MRRGIAIGWWVIFGLVFSSTILVPVRGRGSEQSAASSVGHTGQDQSQEPYVIERYHTAVRFENDGTNERLTSAKIRIQNDVGVEKFGELVFPYNKDNERVEVRSVKINKRNGTILNVPADTVKDLAVKGSGDSPAYPDEMAKHVAVSDLGAGDVLEYEVAVRLTTPFAANQFWFQHNFADDAIVLDEQLELNLPQGRSFSLKGPGSLVMNGRSQPAASVGKDFSFSRKEENGRTRLTWKHENLSHPAEDEQQRAQEHARKSPDVQLTTFESWQQMARWESKLLSAVPDPSADVSAKSRELISGRATEEEKIRALYNFVSKNIRVVNGSFGSEHFKAQPADAVLKNGYGDCADLATLFADMLTAAGIRADTVLIPATRKMDAGLPSPAQFDRVLTVAQNSNATIWLDPSAEIAPFGFLPASLRGKSGLLVASDGTGKIVKTPADPPFASTQRVEIAATVSDLGKLSGTIHYSLRGDTEFVLRGAFHRSPQSEWNELAQTILTLDGLHGDVSSVKTSDPLDTEKPFELNIDFSNQGFVDWSSKKARVALPLLTIGLPDPPANGKTGVNIGSPLDVATHLKLRFPAQFSVQTPTGVAVSRDYAEFKASYRFEDSTLIADRSLNFKMRELPAARASDYLAFMRAVEGDEAQLVSVENSAADTTAVPSSASADDLFDAGTADLKAGNLRGAVPLLLRVTAMDPKHAHAWNDLGLAYFREGKFDEAIAAFRKQLEVNPSDEHANDYLGLALGQQHHNDEAAVAFRRQIELNALDTVAHAALGTMLLEEHDDSGALPELEKAMILSPKNGELEISLGRAYLETGDNQKAIDAFHKGVELSPTATVWNNAAYNLAEHNVDLDDALLYANSAVKAGADSLANVTLAHVTQADFGRVSNLAAYWDTLGWVYFRRGDLQEAERYIRAAWRVSGRGEFCDHLAQIYEKRGEKERAIQTYALALAAPETNPDTRARMMLLLGGNAQIDELVAKARPEIAKDHVVALKHVAASSGSADFLVLVSAHEGEKGAISAKEDGAKFLNGSESLKPFADQLRGMNYGAIFPALSPAKLVMHGTLSCTDSTSECSFQWVPVANPSTRN